MTTKIFKCNCKHESQDKLYGVNKRVFNRTTKEIANKPLYRCTVCKKETTG